MNICIAKRFFLFAVALFVNAFGIAVITKALLGTSPITSVTYVLSMFTPMTIGQWTIALNILFVVLEIPLMTRKELKSDWKMYSLQVPISLCFGMFIDFSMNMLSWLNPAGYISEIFTLLVGCLILAAGIALEVKVDIAMMAGEYFVRVISKRFKWDFGYVKLGFDISLVCIACILSVLFMSGIYGVREGTVIAALVVGPIVHFLGPYYRVFDSWITESEVAKSIVEVSSGNKVITIAREFGSGGHILGEMVAKQLGIPCYDKEFIHFAAQRSGMDEQYIIRNEQYIPSFWLKCIIGKSSEQSIEHSLSPDDILFVAESKIIQELAQKSSCVIIGRCADFILHGNKNTIKIFCYSDLQNAAVRCVEEYGIPREKAEAEIKRVNRARIAHYEYYTGVRWGEAHNYDLMINTSCIDLQTACDIIKNIYRREE